ncbi:hypothetical protein BVI2075_280006 [Burkholderia vietnamiensis]|nr:hypothetical protein BVI2075_280006 [Burkholderia vietnamiensis]
MVIKYKYSRDFRVRAARYIYSFVQCTSRSTPSVERDENSLEHSGLQSPGSDVLQPADSDSLAPRFKRKPVKVSQRMSLPAASSITREKRNQVRRPLPRCFLLVRRKHVSLPLILCI